MARAIIQGYGVNGKFAIKVEHFGLGETIAAAMRFGEKARFELGRQLVREATRIMKKSVEIVPVDQGTLRASAGVQPLEVSGDSMTVEMGYGGAATMYALRQHETPPSIYSHRAGTRWKYLEEPFRAATADIDERLAANLGARLDRMVKA
jgi:hypothetical protein